MILANTDKMTGQRGGESSREDDCYQFTKIVKDDERRNTPQYDVILAKLWILCRKPARK
jgi:hypothetical protein